MSFGVFVTIILIANYVSIFGMPIAATYKKVNYKVAHFFEGMCAFLSIILSFVVISCAAIYSGFFALGAINFMVAYVSSSISAQIKIDNDTTP